jgi:hypothetical protein
VRHAGWVLRSIVADQDLAVSHTGRKRGDYRRIDVIVPLALNRPVIERSAIVMHCHGDLREPAPGGRRGNGSERSVFVRAPARERAGRGDCASVLVPNPHLRERAGRRTLDAEARVGRADERSVAAHGADRGHAERTWRYVRPTGSRGSAFCCAQPLAPQHLIVPADVTPQASTEPAQTPSRAGSTTPSQRSPTARSSLPCG